MSDLAWIIGRNVTGYFCRRDLTIGELNLKGMVVLNHNWLKGWASVSDVLNLNWILLL
jgi:hypothetical protein